MMIASGPEREKTGKAQKTVVLFFSLFRSFHFRVTNWTDGEADEFCNDGRERKKSQGKYTVKGIEKIGMEREKKKRTKAMKEKKKSCVNKEKQSGY